MEALPVKVRKLRPEARIPLYATGGAAGADLFACLDEPLVMAPGARARIPTGIALEITETGFAALVFARSGPAHRQGLALTNGVGVVDEDYRGEIGVLAVNLGQEAITLHPGERIAQMIFMPVCRAVFLESACLADTERGGGGFGSTGQF